MFEVRVEADFAAAHFLRDYHGKCENLHGHNYTVFAHVQGPSLDSGGMLLDFSQLKAALKKVIATLDHTNLNDIPFFDQNPSAERIALYIYQNLKKELESAGVLPHQEASGTPDCISHTSTAPSGTNAVPRIRAIDVFETPTSRARYIPDIEHSL